jgi:branched-chain amino acid transport system permease protein
MVRPPTSPLRESPLSLLVVLAAFLIAPAFLAGNYQYGIAHQVLIFIILATGYNILLGYTGMVSLGHVALFAIGAYASAILQTSLDWPFLACFAAASVLTGLFGTVIAIPALRIKGHYLTLLTLALGEAIRLLIRNFEWLTNGSRGLGGISRPVLFGVRFGTAADLYWLLLAFAAFGVWFAWRLQHSRFGLAFKATRDSEIGAEVIGIKTSHVKVLSFGISAIYAGAAGSLYAHTLRFVSPEFFGLGLTITLLAMILIGGRGMILGPVIGATLLIVTPEALRFIKQYYLMASGIVIWLCTLYLPDGIAGTMGRVKARLLKRRPGVAS